MRKVFFDVETSNTFEDASYSDSDDFLKGLNISVASVYDSATDSFISFEIHEFGRLWPIFEHADIIIGFNSDHFDIPLLNKYYPGDLTRLRSLDLLKEVKNSLGRRIKLDTLAEATLGKKKSGHGLQAIEWWRQGEKEKVKRYCEDDVRITKELYDFALANGHIKFKDRGEIKIIKLDTKNWETRGEASMTHTLPF